jgi:hypothetical protein
MGNGVISERIEALRQRCKPGKLSHPDLHYFFSAVISALARLASEAGAAAT